MIQHSKKHLRVGVLAAVLLMIASLVLLPGSASAGTFPGVNGRILMTDISSGPYFLSSVKPDGTDYKAVLDDNVSKADVEYSPDGTKIAYTQTVSSTVQVFTANADGTNPLQITSSSEHTYTPSWSPDGTKILYGQAVSGSVRIYRMNADGTSQTELTSSASYYDPEYSPDGTKIVALLDASDDEVVIMNADGSSIVNLTNNSVNEQKASWSPNGNKLVYSSPVSGSHEIFTMNIDGSSNTQLTSSGLGFRVPEYSPDGTKIAFIDNLAPSLLYVMNADGTNRTEIAAGWPRDFSWQPLTILPSSSTPNPSITVSNGVANLDIASMYTDVYEGIDKATVAVTSTPTSGTTSVNSTTGVITYTQDEVAASGGFWSNVSAIFFPKVSAASTDSFTYRICSESSSSLCSTGTVSVLGLSSGTLAETGDDTKLASTIAQISLLAYVSIFLVLHLRKRQNNN